MATIVSEETSGGRMVGGLSSGSRCQSSDALTEWRSSEQLENGTPSTSPPYWDTDDSDDDGGLKPTELYGKYTWKIEKFSQITKRELRSNAFEVGGYKWYILIYPQGCDVCNHLSLFLCVANHDKLLPGWSHFAQFTIAVVNKDPKKSKYSDTLHRFWKKEHDWGWKKFMELSKVSDGFVDADTLIIKAQVQVIREKADRPFRCLDCQYRRELVRVYLTNVEQICRRFVEERRGKLEKLIEDKARWSSFCAFWLAMDQNMRRRMSRESKDTILKVVVKHFFIEKEVTSTLVMDSLHSGLKALEGQHKKGTSKLLEGEETPPPIIRSEKDTFVLVDDVLLLLEKAAMEPLPPKDDKGPQNRTKDGSGGEYFTKDSIERDEKRLTELGRRTVEIFVLAHIFSNKIEVAYQEAVALRRQEELIREEEAAWLAESEQKAKRGGGEKDKKSKKKQGKQKRNNRRGKDKPKDEKPVAEVPDKQLLDNPSSVGKENLKDDALEDVSDISDIAECAVDMLQPDSEDREGSPINWDTDTSEVQPPAEASGSEVSSISTVHNGGVDKRSSSLMDDSSSTCSTDSTPSVVTNGSYRSNSFVNCKSQNSPARGKNQRGKSTFEECSGPNEADSRQSQLAEVHIRYDASPRRKVVETNVFEGAIQSLQDRIKWPELNAIKKEDEVVLLQRKQNKDNNNNNIKTASKEKKAVPVRTSKSPPCKPSSATTTTTHQPKTDLKILRPADVAPPKKTPSNDQQQQLEKPTSTQTTPRMSNPSRPHSQIATISKPIEKPTVKVQQQQQPVGLSRPSSAPLIPATLAATLSATTPVVSMVQAAATTTTTTTNGPVIPRSVSATGRLGHDPPLASAPAYVPQSFRNNIAGGNSFTPNSIGFTHPVFLAHSSERNGPTFSATPKEELFRGQPWTGSSVSNGYNDGRNSNSNSMFDSQSTSNDNVHRFDFDLYRRPVNNGYKGHGHGQGQAHFPSEISAGTSGRPVQTQFADEFPHLDIINDLLDDEQVIGRSYSGSSSTRFNGQFTYPSDISCLSLSSNDRSMGFRQDYGPGSPFNHQGNSNSIPYLNGQIDNNLAPNQWQLLGPDLSFLRSSGSDCYPYNVPDYSTTTYSMFRPSNGH